MNDVKVKNTENTILKLLFKGVSYELLPQETKSFPKDVAKQWFTIYGFLQFEKQVEMEEVEDVVEEAEEVKVVTKKVTKKK